MRCKILTLSAMILFLSCGLAYSGNKPELHLPFPAGDFRVCSQPNSGSTSHSYSTTRYALDFEASVGSPLLAMTSGIAYVYENPSGYDYESYGGFGCHVKIDHGDGYYTLYGHMRSISVNNEEFIGVGEQIGTSGGDGSFTHICNGHTTGAHIHISLHQGDATASSVGSSVSSKIFAATSSSSNAYLMSSASFLENHSYWSDTEAVNLDDYFTCDTYGCYVCSTPCQGGGQGLPDFVVMQIWLEDGNGNEKFVFRPGEQIKIRSKIKNAGDGDSPSDITVKFYLSDGYNVDENKEHIETAEVDSGDLESGETKSETEYHNAPSTPGIYNITACADTEEEVEEEHESNNCSDEAVFRVDDLAWLVPINSFIMH
jgi:hypothetical protein